MTGEDSTASAHHIAIYDGGCAICTDFAVVLRKLVSPRTLDVVPCGSMIQKKIASEVASSECLQDFTLVMPDGTALRGAEAVRETLLLSAWLKGMRPLFLSRPGRWLAQMIHMGARRRRARKGCCGNPKSQTPNPNTPT